MEWGALIAALALLWAVARWLLDRRGGEEQIQALWEYQSEFFRKLDSPPHRGRPTAGRCQAQFFFLKSERELGKVQSGWRHAPRGFRRKYEAAQAALKQGWKSELDEEKGRSESSAAAEIQVSAEMESLRLLQAAWRSLL